MSTKRYRLIETGDESFSRELKDLAVQLELIAAEFLSQLEEDGVSADSLCVLMDLDDRPALIAFIDDPCEQVRIGCE